MKTQKTRFIWSLSQFVFHERDRKTHRMEIKSIAREPSANIMDSMGPITNRDDLLG